VSDCFRADAVRRNANRTGFIAAAAVRYVVRDPTGSSSDPIAGPPDEKKKGCDHSDQDQHPILAFEPEKRKTLDEKLHRSRSPFFWAE
jgi:hypothetical protein